MTLQLNNIYIVDDDQSFGRSLQRLLGARGIYADHFRSAQSFLDSVSPDQKGCAVIDIQMPGCDGFSLIEKMRAMHYHMPVVVVTGQPHLGDRDRAMKEGAVGFLLKPFSEDSLLELLRKLSND